MSVLKPRLKSADCKDNEFNSPLDLVHLSCQTRGDADLEHDLLTLFSVQCQTCRELLGQTLGQTEIAGSESESDASIVKSIAQNEKINAEIAQKMKTSAHSIGAWNVAKTALALEYAPLEQCHIDALVREIATAENYINKIA